MKANAQMGQYEIYEIIGKGGLATIFLARDTDKGPQSPLLALKCMNPEAANHEMAVTGFFQEIKLLRAFKHQNLLSGQDSGKQRGVHYVVTDFIDGQNLRSINARLQSTGNIMSLLPFLISEVLAGLDYLHEIKDENGKEMRIIHNDLTPGNILVGYEGEVKIADFGAATFDGHPLGSSGEPAVMGTLSYLAPEKLLGHNFDKRADIYAVGVMLYELALGVPPYRHHQRAIRPHRYRQPRSSRARDRHH
jgi:serine/threonine-protein kinase